MDNGVGTYKWGMGAQAGKAKREEGEATFDDIAKAIGTTRQGAEWIYLNAMRKLRRNKIAMRQLGALLEEKARQRTRGEVSQC